MIQNKIKFRFTLTCLIMNNNINKQIHQYIQIQIQLDIKYIGINRKWK